MDLTEQKKKQEEALRYMKTVLGQNIRLRREKLGYSQEKVAFLAGMGAAHLGNIERGNDKNNPTLSTLLKISVALHTTLEQLLEGACLPEPEQETDSARRAEEARQPAAIR